ncbi:MAG: ABC transporter substrate-binding protein [Pseudomonadota bacterium]
MRFLWATVALLVLSFCEKDQHGLASGAGLVVIDDLGQSVALPAPAKRIAALSPSNVEILWAIGCGSKIVLRDKISVFPAQVQGVPATDVFRLSPEHVAGFRPDLILLSHQDASRVAALRAIGLIVATFDPKTVEQVYRNIMAVGLLCGAPDKARSLITKMRERVQKVREQVDKQPVPKVYVEIDGADPLKPWTVGSGSFVDQLIRMAGGQNIAAGLNRPYAQISAEEVLSRQPDFVILTVGDDGRKLDEGKRALLRRPGWQALRAVREGRIIDNINAHLLTRPGPRLVEALEALARALHPGASS